MKFFFIMLWLLPATWSLTAQALTNSIPAEDPLFDAVNFIHTDAIDVMGRFFPCGKLPEFDPLISHIPQ